MECIYCKFDDEINKLVLWGMDGDFIHPSCIPLMERQNMQINLMTDNQFFNYMLGEE